MKYTYIHSAYDKNLICVETHEIVPVILPDRIPINTYGERVKESEREAIERYEAIKKRFIKEILTND